MRHGCRNAFSAAAGAYSVWLLERIRRVLRGAGPSPKDGERKAAKALWIKDYEKQKETEFMIE